ncbi:MAG TPA: IS110 family transposase [Candidatus Saccharimonadales bacterium]|nr:IS110 family transposase [Candidatus Saccharimonadales bacterium]
MFVLGFDVAKDKLDVALVNHSGQLKDRYLVKNTKTELTKLIKTVWAKHPKLTAGCEATGSYHMALVKVCLDLNVELKILNPLITRQYSRATIRGRKTDLDDALSIARLILRGEGKLASELDTSLPKIYGRIATKITQAKQALDLQRQFLVRLGANKDISRLFEPANKALEQLSKDLRDKAMEGVSTEDYRLIQSIVGVGPITAASVLAEIGDIKKFPSSAKLIAYSGLDPRVKQSGATLNRNTKLTKRGSPELRRVLFLAANIARQHDPELRAYYQNKRDQGKAYTPAVVAVSQKLTNRIYAVLTRQTPYIRKST